MLFDKPSELIENQHDYVTEVTVKKFKDPFPNRAPARQPTC